MKMIVATVLIIIGLTALSESENFSEETEILTEKSVNLTPIPVKWNAQQEYCLAQNIYFEAGNQSLDGMAAVADVTLNRVQNGRYPNDICSVVKEGLKHPNGMMKRNMCQFSWYCDGKSDNVPAPTTSQSWRQALSVSNAILNNNKYRGITEGSTHYHAVYVTPDWISDRGMKRIRQIGSHIFYKFW